MDSLEHTLELWQIHGFFEMFSVMTDAQRAVNVAGDAVRRAFPSIQPSKEFSCDR